MPIKTKPKMLEFNRDQLQETEVHLFEAEASALGLRPSKFPSEFATDLGNGLTMRAYTNLPCGGVEYRQDYGCIRVRIIND